MYIFSLNNKTILHVCLKYGWGFNLISSQECGPRNECIDFDTDTCIQLYNAGRCETESIVKEQCPVTCPDSGCNTRAPSIAPVAHPTYSGNKIYFVKLPKRLILWGKKKIIYESNFYQNLQFKSYHRESHARY